MDYASSVMPNPSSIHAFGMEAKKKLEKHKDEGLSEAYIEAISCLNVTQELIKIAEK